MTRNRRGMIAAMSVLGVAALLFSVALVRAMTIEPWTPLATEDPVQAPELTDDVAAVEARVPSEAALSTSDIALAVDNDPFLPDRSRADAFRFPGDEPLEMPEPPAAAPVPQFELTGTIVGGDGGVAVINVGDAPPLVLGVGESLLGFRLDAVAASTATLVRGEQTLYLSLASGTPQRAPANDRNSRNANRSVQFNQEMIRTLQQRFGEGITGLIERVRQGGANQAQAQAMLEQMLQQGGRGRGGTTIRFRRDTTAVPMRTPDKP